MRGLWSLGDQAILSLGNFFTNWLLLRKLPEGRYGNYYIVLSFILFLNNLHTAWVTYPLSVTSAGISDGELRRRVRRAIGMTLLLAIPESLVICWGTVATVGWHLVPWVIGAMMLWQLQETVRRALMARLEHRRAIFGDAVSYLGQAAAVWFITRSNAINLETAFAIVALTSGVAMLIQAMQLGLFTPSETPPVHTMRHQAHHHWVLGQWVLLSCLVNLLTVYSIPWVIRYYNGAPGAAMYSAVLLVLNASNPLLASVANLITPVVAKAKADAEARGQSGGRETQNAALKYAVQGALVLFPFFAFLIIAPGFVLHIFYKPGSPYLQLTTAMRIFPFAYALIYISAMFTSYLCGLGKSRLPFYGQIINAIITCLITLPLVARYGVIGAAWGAIIPAAGQVAVGAYYTLRVRRDLSETHPAGAGTA